MSGNLWRQVAADQMADVLSGYAKASDVAQFVSPTRMHVADILSQFPPSSELRGKYATVDDLFGAIDGVLRCGTDGVRYYWQPSGLPEYASPMTVGGDLMLTALQHPTILALSGSIALGVTRKISLSTDNVWPGARKRISTRGIVSLLGTLSVLSGVNSLLNMIAGNEADFAVDYSSGQPQWVRV